MHDSVLVRRFQCFRDLPRERQRAVEWNRAVREPVREGRSIDQLEHERLNPVRMLHAVDRGDVRVIERGQNLRLSIETHHVVAIVDHVLRHDFEGDIALQSRVAGTVDIAHGPRAEPRGHCVGPHLTTGESAPGARASSSAAMASAGASRKSLAAVSHASKDSTSPRSAASSAQARSRSAARRSWSWSNASAQM